MALNRPHDLLEMPKPLPAPVNASGDLYDMYEKQLRLLERIHYNTQIPSIPATLNLQFNNGQRILTRALDHCRITFQYQGKPIKPHLLIIANSTDNNMVFTLNEPIIHGTSVIDMNGIELDNVGASIPYIIIPARVEFIEVATSTTGTGQAISVNNSAGAVPAQGTITVYAWTVPNADKFETE